MNVQSRQGERRHNPDRRQGDVLSNLLAAIQAATDEIKAHAQPPAPISPQAASWTRPEVRAARIVHDRVQVVGKGEFKSTPEAFRQLGLSMGRMSPFRLRLKAAGRAVFKGVAADGAEHAYEFIKA